MQALIEPLRFTEDGRVPQLYAFNLLGKFHALRFPEQYIVDPVFGVPTAEDVSPMSYYDAGETVLKPELDLLDRNLRLSDIAREISITARPVLLFLATTKPQKDLPSALTEYCQQQDTLKHRADWAALVDNNHHRLTAAKILPPAEVVKSMHDSWNIRQIRRCYPLERFIGQTLAQTAWFFENVSSKSL